MKEPILSIKVPVYNHEKYIAQCLDSILMQKTQYSFEVLVGEDKSTDNSRKILEDYERKYPGFFTMFYREKNMNNSSCKNGRDLALRCKGKYVITLEGDDYWLSSDKIEKQISFLETHPEFFAVSCKCIVVNENGVPTGEKYNECNESEYTFSHFANDILPGQTATFMMRNVYRMDCFDTSLISQGLVPGDRLLYFSVICNYRIYCMQETMSAYRKVVSHGSSFSANLKWNFFREEHWHKAMLLYAHKIGNKEAIIYSESTYIRITIDGLLGRDISFGQWVNLVRSIKNLNSWLLFLKYALKKKILKIKNWY